MCQPGPLHKAEHFSCPPHVACEQGATEGWAAARDWVAADGSVDLDFLEQRFGDAQVLVTDTARQGGGGRFLCWLTVDMQSVVVRATARQAFPSSCQLQTVLLMPTLCPAGGMKAAAHASACAWPTS